MGWVVGGVWIGAGVLAVLVLAFSGYELAWKSRRLRREAKRLQVLGQRAKDMQHAVAAIQLPAQQLD